MRRKQQKQRQAEGAHVSEVQRAAFSKAPKQQWSCARSALSPWR
jgi:ABC-type amino acid transport system permease subunit